MKRISLLLALLLVLTPIFASCGEEIQDGSTSTEVTEQNTPAFDIASAGELDFGQKEFGIFGVRGGLKYLFSEEENGDLVNDAIYGRNRTIEERYNLKFNMVEAEPNVGADQIRNFVLSGDKTYHLYQSTQHNGMPAMILDGYFVDWNEMPAIKSDQPYWNSNAAKDINYGGKIFVFGGDLNLSTYNSTNCILFNKKLFDDLGIDYPYDYVYDNTWTIDKLMEISKQGYADLNGNSEWDTDGDQVGFTGWGWEMNLGIFVGLGGKTVVNDENNMPVLALNNPVTVKIIDKMIEVFDGQTGFSNFEKGVHTAMFTGGRVLMMDGFITGLATNRDSAFDIGLVPYPMLDETQGEYYSRAANIAHLSYVPTTNTELIETGIVLEGMSIESYNTVRPTYYDITLNLKEAADEETVDMVDIVLDSSTYIYEGFVNASQLNKYLKSRTNTFASWYESERRGFEKTVQKMVKFYS